MKNNGGKKSRPLWLKLVVIVLLALLGLVLLAAALGFGLLGRVTRPAPILTPTTPAPLTPTPTSTPTAVLADVAIAPATTPAPTPEPTPLPLSEVCEQTLLTEAQYAQMQAENADTAFKNVLLIGVDRRGSSGNSSADTMMIATLDSAHSRLKLTSLLRDMLLEIPGAEDYNKLNSAASKGGVELLMQTINKNFRLELTSYVLVDFQMFIDIVDRMGGVTVKMSAQEISAANDCIAGLNKQWGVDYLWDGFIFAEAGNVKCTGKQALGYARIRHTDSDFKRTERQYKVLQAVYAKFRAQNAARQYALLYDLLPYVETNMTNTEILDTAVSALGLDIGGLLHTHAPADGTYQAGRYARKAVLLTDITKNALLLHEFIYENADAAEPAMVLAPGASLPPRTPRPTYMISDINGRPVYYYEDGTLVPGQDLQSEQGAPGLQEQPQATPWQSLG